MSKKSQPAAEAVKSAPAPAAEPKPPAIPNPDDHPAVTAAVARHDALMLKLADVRAERKRLEREVGAKPGESDDDVEARLMARGHPAGDLAKLREARRVEKVTAQAAELVAADVRKARDTATRELTAAVREGVFLPAVRAAVKDWLEAVNKIEAFRRLVDDVQARGVGSGTHCPFNGRVPLSLADRDGFAAFARELIGDGFTDANTINAAVPGLI